MLCKGVSGLWMTVGVRVILICWVFRWTVVGVCLFWSILHGFLNTPTLPYFLPFFSSSFFSFLRSSFLSFEILTFLSRSINEWKVQLLQYVIYFFPALKWVSILNYFAEFLFLTIHEKYY